MKFGVLTFWFTQLIEIFRGNNKPAQTTSEIITGSGNPVTVLQCRIVQSEQHQTDM